MLWCEAGCCAAIAWSLTERTRVMGSCSWRWKLHPTSAATGAWQRCGRSSGGGRGPRWRRFLVEASGWVRLWILAFNSGGIDALASKPRPGRPRKVKLERVRDLLVPVLEEPGKAGQRHWTGVKLLRRDEYRLLPVFFGSIGRDHSSRAGQMPSPFHR